MRSFFISILLLFFSISSSAETIPHNNSSTKKIKHVIYITLDGVRWQDIFIDHSYFAKIWKKYAEHLHFYGTPNSNITMEVASIPISLPSYQSQMAGSVTLCTGNDCGRIRIETVVENILHKLNLHKKDVAIFSSWTEIGLACEHILGTTYSNTGNKPAYDPYTGEADEVMFEINRKQESDPAGDGDRFDRYTFAQAMHYFEKYRPLFLWISLAESDNTAHEGDLAGYHQSLITYDDMLDALLTRLKNLHISDETLIIVTTDHGRGNGDNWTEHGPQYPESKQTWAFVMNGELKAVTENHYSTLSIRPTVEKALGI